MTSEIGTFETWWGVQLESALCTKAEVEIISKQPSARMILEQFGIANVTPEGVHRLVTRNIHHFEDGSTLGRRRSQEA